MANHIIFLDDDVEDFYLKIALELSFDLEKVLSDALIKFAEELAIRVLGDGTLSQ